jgi:site-specific DNA-adenine methylase
MGAKGVDATQYVELFRRRTDSGEPIRRLVDTNFGAGNIISAASDYPVRISNDLDSEIALLADMVSREKDRDAVIDRVLQLEVTRENFLQCQEYLKKAEGSRDKVECAARIWFLFLNSFNGNRKHWSSVQEMKENVLLAKLETLDTFDGVQVLNMDMLDLLEKEKADKAVMEHTMYFLDPPYLENRAGYKCNSAGVEFHRKLTEVVRGIPYIMICGYDNPVYEEHLCGKQGFHKYLLNEKAVTMGYVKPGEMRKRKEEYIWTSYPVVGAYQQ